MDNILEAIAGIVVSITLLDIAFRLLRIWNGDEALDRAIEESKPNPSRRRFDMKLLDVKALAVKWAASEARMAEARLELAAHFKAFAKLTPEERETLRDEIHAINQQIHWEGSLAHGGTEA